MSSHHDSTAPSAVQRVFDVEELREMIFESVGDGLFADLLRYMRVTRSWYHYFSRLFYATLDLSGHYNSWQRWCDRAQIDLLTRRPDLAQLVKWIYSGDDLPYHLLDLVLKICVHAQSLVFHRSSERLPFSYRRATPIPPLVGTQITDLTLDLDRKPSDGIELLLAPLPNVSILRLDGPSDMQDVLAILKALGSRVQELDLETPFIASVDDSEDNAANWTKLLLTLPSLVSLSITGRAVGLAGAGSAASATLAKLSLSNALPCDYAPLVESFEDPSWCSGLTSLPKLTLIEAEEVESWEWDGEMYLRAARDTPTEEDYMALVDIGVSALRQRPGMVIDQEAEATLATLAKRGWELYKDLVRHKDDVDHHLLTEFAEEFPQAFELDSSSSVASIASEASGSLGFNASDAS